MQPRIPLGDEVEPWLGDQLRPLPESIEKKTLSLAYILRPHGFYAIRGRRESILTLELPQHKTRLGLVNITI